MHMRDDNRPRQELVNEVIGLRKQVQDLKDAAVARWRAAARGWAGTTRSLRRPDACRWRQPLPRPARQALRLRARRRATTPV